MSLSPAMHPGPRAPSPLQGTVRPRLACLLATLLTGALMAGMAGCRDDDPAASNLANQDITPLEFWDKPPDEQFRIRRTKIYIPEGCGRAEIAPNSGPWDTPLERMVHQGETDFFIWQLARTMFEFEHPTIHLEGMAFDMWSGDMKAILGTALHSERSPAMYIARNLPESMLDGWFADITDYMDRWPEARDHEVTKALGTFDGRIYCLADNVTRWPVIVYRKDMFAEIGVTNEFGEPGPRSDWTWADFRDYARQLSRDTDGDGKIDRWGFVAERHRFDMMYTPCHGLEFRLYVPDPTGEFIWRFNPDEPQWREGIRKVREMYWVDKSVLTGVDYTWLAKEYEFASENKVAMALAGSGHPPEWALTKPMMFGGNIQTIDVLGMVPMPRSTPAGTDDRGFLYPEVSCNMFGFNPLYTPEQLEASIDWFKSWTAGYYNFIFQTSLRHKNKAWGRPDPFPAADLTKTYEPTVPLPQGEGREIYPKDWRNVYDVYGDSELFPTPQRFGLLRPVQFGDVLNNLQSDLLFTKPTFTADGRLDPKAEERLIDAIIARHTPRIEQRCMTAKPRSPEHAAEVRDRMKEYYEAVREYAHRNMPPALARDWVDFIETKGLIR